MFLRQGVLHLKPRFHRTWHTILLSVWTANRYMELPLLWANDKQVHMEVVSAYRVVDSDSMVMIEGKVAMKSMMVLESMVVDSILLDCGPKVTEQNFAENRKNRTSVVKNELPIHSRGE